MDYLAQPYFFKFKPTAQFSRSYAIIEDENIVAQFYNTTGVFQKNVFGHSPL